MTIPDEPLNILACPRCKGPIQPSAAGDRLVCNACGLAYPVREGIPVLLVEDAEQTIDR